MILTTIKELKEQIRKANKAPVIVPLSMLTNRMQEKGINREQSKKMLNELYASGKIRVGKTINDYYIEEL